MKQFLNTLYVSRQKTYLFKEGECVCMKYEDAITRIPIHIMDSLVLFGNVSCSPFLLDHCAKNGVTVSWLTEYGRFMASMHGPVSGNVLLRREQYRKADSPEFSAALARAFTIGKIYNCRTILRRTARERPDPRLDAACERLTYSLERLKKDIPLDVARGIEGESASLYFGVFDLLVSNPDPVFSFQGRNRRPPLDPVNCLLSFLYTLLTHDVRSALETVGLDPAVGFLHRDRPGRPSLALDVMEEFRPYLADRLACTLINKGQLRAKGFKIQESGAVVMDDETRKAVITAWQERKKEEIEHPFLKERMPVGLLWHMQARLLARYIRGDLDAYPPFVVR
ncbi:type I-C CRISPR-associated endonuclease Cas1c [Desulfosarcina sp. OttesenSCG-928-A07]|nr:type I-C CRISPR-associated endonuclease Cas1c [Desulfosarcina sp. OttesenSCG-928-G17]MDL2329588.1 type I-C CRISPR-associated endonuclease Cas1c [Desulfosarcina sp. OttesenSCG-928-A07]